jgi:hypothetical protein
MKKHVLLSCQLIPFLFNYSSSGVTDYALSFNGSSAYVDLASPDALQPAGGHFSAEAWIYIEDGAGTDQKVLMTLGGWARGYAMNIYNDGGGYYFAAGIYLNGNNYFASSSTTFIATHTWTHVAMTWSENGNITAYLNGVKTAETPTDAYSYSLSGNTVMIGCGYTNIYFGYFNGMIDEVRTWNTTRTALEISDDMNKTLNGSEAGLTGYYAMNSGSGSSLADNQTNETANDGTIYNAAWITSTAPLPVELTSFTASVSRGSVVLHWETATEVNNTGFEIERSKVNCEKWEKIGFVEGHGSTNAPHSYSFSDAPDAEKTLYRLKQIDRDGRFEYSKVVEAVVGGLASFALDQNYPNPFNPGTVINYSIAAPANVQLKVYDILGGEVATLVNEFKGAGRYSVAFNASALANGVYFYKLQAGRFSEVKKLSVMK